MPAPPPIAPAARYCDDATAGNAPETGHADGTAHADGKPQSTIEARRHRRADRRLRTPQLAPARAPPFRGTAIPPAARPQAAPMTAATTHLSAPGVAHELRATFALAFPLIVGQLATIGEN